MLFFNLLSEEIMIFLKNNIDIQDHSTAIRCLQYHNISLDHDLCHIFNVFLSGNLCRKSSTPVKEVSQNHKDFPLRNETTLYCSTLSNLDWKIKFNDLHYISDTSH